MTLGNRIAHHRGRLRLSQLELAEKLGVSRQSVSKWETDASTPELEKLVEMGKIFDITLDALITGAEVEATEPASSAPQPVRSTRETAGIICTISGLVGLLLGLLIPIVWLLAVPLLIVGLYLLSPGAALKLSWVLLFVLLLCVRSFTSASLSIVTASYAYETGMWAQLIVSYILWALIVIWTLCAMKTPWFRQRKLLAIGWGLVLVIAENFMALFHLVVYYRDYAWGYFTPLGYVNILLSAAIPVVVVVATLRAKKSK